MHTYPPCQADTIHNLGPCEDQIDGIHKIPNQDVWVCGPCLMKLLNLTTPNR